MTEPRRSANTGPSVTPGREITVRVPHAVMQAGGRTAVTEYLNARGMGEYATSRADVATADYVYVGQARAVWHPRRPLTLEEASRGDLPKPFSPEEWKAMHQASCGGGQNRA